MEIILVSAVGGLFRRYKAGSAWRSASTIEAHVVGTIARPLAANKVVRP